MEKKIKITGENSLYEIINKINKTQEKETQIYLEIDENEVLKNYLNLKILLAKVYPKKIGIISANKDLKKVGEKLGIKYYVKSDEIEFEQKFQKTNVLKYNFTFKEFLSYEIKKFFSKILFFSSKKIKKTYKGKTQNKDSSLFLLLIGLVLSFTLLSFIFYFAVSKTYVYISPELSVKTVSRNIVYSEKDNGNVFDNKNVIKVNPISVNSSYSFPFRVSSIDESSAKNAYGKVEITNELSIEQIFKPNTRFISDNGVVFRTNEWIKIPPSTKTSSGKLQIGKLETTLIADTYDDDGKITGTRGNIGENTILTIPGLKFNRDKIYAKTLEKFQGGLDPVDHVLTEDEYKKFETIIKDKIKAKALDDIKDKIKTMNSAGGSNFQILPIDNILQYNIGEVSTSSGAKIGNKMEEVTLSVSGSLSTYVFDKSATVFYLKAILSENILLGTEKLIGVNEDSLKITNILSQTTNPFSIKATTELDSTISYNFEDKTNNLTRKLKNLIVNSSKKEATSILLNDPNIANVKIEFSPFWLSHVSSNPDNIEFIIQK